MKKGKKRKRIGERIGEQKEGIRLIWLYWLFLYLLYTLLTLTY